MSIWYILEKAEPIINSFDPAKEYSDINEVIELYNVQQLMDSGTVLKRWTDDTIERLKKTCRQFSAIIVRFFAGITNSNFITSVHSLNNLYTEDFWALVEKYKVYERIDGKVLSELLREESTVLWPILEHKNLVAHYDVELAEILRSSDQTAELLLDSFLSDGKRKYYFPKSLLPSEFESIFRAYVDSDFSNPNYLNLIVISQSSKECPISVKLKQQAKHRYDDEVKKRFSTSTGIEYGVGVGFADIDSFTEVDNKNTLTPLIKYDTKWITDNLDYPTLLNNFRYVFDQTDMCWRCNLVSLKYNLGILEQTLGVKGKKEYQIGMQFRLIDMTSVGQIRGYRNLLSENGVDIENVFQWFFTDYLNKEFNVNGFSFSASSPDSSYVERIRNIASEMDGVLKQFRAFLEDGYIDRELFEMSSAPAVFSQIGSFFSDKYAYSNSEELQTEMHLLFSDQSHLTYTERTQTKYHSLGDMLTKEQMNIADFAEYQIRQIEWLITRGSIRKDEHGIFHVNVARFTILRDLFIHEVICPHYYITYHDAVEMLVSTGDLCYGSTLFSKPEQRYLNYMLNQSEFSNGLDLRNKYIHGTYPRDKETQETDYDHLLIIMALVIMKINEEFCLKYPLSD